MAMNKGSGLTDEEAKALHGNVVSVAIVFTAIAVVAHILMWMWRPWIPGIAGYKSSVSDAVQSILPAFTTLIG
jgi:light-harvesting complex 1 beta chain